jgi:hypothetical protein
MAYSTSNPPVPVSWGPLAGFNANEPGGTNTTPKLWVYSSADPIATVQGAAYFSNGLTLGMRVGDIVFVVDNNLVRMYPSFVVSVLATAGAPAVAGTGSATINSTTTLLAD